MSSRAAIAKRSLVIFALAIAANFRLTAITVASMLEARANHLSRLLTSRQLVRVSGLKEIVPFVGSP
jgi:hypothetical protein